jgi:hypothetical protein
VENTWREITFSKLLDIKAVNPFSTSLQFIAVFRISPFILAEGNLVRLVIVAGKLALAN